MGTPKRQRHKENRQARLEAERAAAARAKRRRQLVTIVGGSLLLFVALAFIATRGGDDDGNDAAAPTTTSPEAPPTTPPPSPVSTIPNGPKPEVTVPEGDLPTELVVEDLVEGDGAEANAGDQIVMHYVGIAASTGEEFDESYTENRPIGSPRPLILGQGMVIPGWDQGVEGMKVGGRRRLIIPPDLGYGPDGQPPVIGPDETLIFEVELVGVGEPEGEGDDEAEADADAEAEAEEAGE